VTAGRRWPLVIAGMLVGNVLAVGTLVGLSHAGGRSQIVDGYGWHAADATATAADRAARAVARRAWHAWMARRGAGR
jgi:hypothetical protein